MGLTLKLGSLVVDMSKLLLLKGQEGLTNRRKSQTEPAGLGLRAPWYGTGNGVVVVRAAAVVQAAVVVWWWWRHRGGAIVVVVVPQLWWWWLLLGLVCVRRGMARAIGWWW
jgi:hypothetical protein